MDFLFFNMVRLEISSDDIHKLHESFSNYDNKTFKKQLSKYTKIKNYVCSDITESKYIKYFEVSFHSNNLDFLDFFESIESKYNTKMSYLITEERFRIWYSSGHYYQNSDYIPSWAIENTFIEYMKDTKNDRVVFDSYKYLDYNEKNNIVKYMDDDITEKVVDNLYLETINNESFLSRFEYQFYIYQSSCISTKDQLVNFYKQNSIIIKMSQNETSLKSVILLTTTLFLFLTILLKLMGYL